MTALELSYSPSCLRQCSPSVSGYLLRVKMHPKVGSLPSSLADGKAVSRASAASPFAEMPDHLYKKMLIQMLAHHRGLCGLHSTLLTLLRTCHRVSGDKNNQGWPSCMHCSRLRRNQNTCQHRRSIHNCTKVHHFSWGICQELPR